MPAGNSLPDLLGRTVQVRGDEVWYRFANGLTITAEVLNKPDPLRILPLGSPQSALMNHLANFPESVRDKYVFEPFAGSGPLGFMALKLGARHVDFLDVNSRAAEFHRRIAELNEVPPDRFNSIVGDIADFISDRRYQLIVANPPFVPTPAGIDGVITSNGGPEGNRFVALLFGRLDELLEENGEALVYLFQFVNDGRPLVMDLISQTLEGRAVELTPSQRRPIRFEAFCKAYVQLFPHDAEAIKRWESALIHAYGQGITLCHYIAHVRSKTNAETSCVIRDNFAEKFGASFFVPSDVDEQLAQARVVENVVPAGQNEQNAV
jgi:hypothetical protein